MSISWAHSKSHQQVTSCWGWGQRWDIIYWKYWEEKSFHCIQEFYEFDNRSMEEAWLNMKSPGIWQVIQEEQVSSEITADILSIKWSSISSHTIFSFIDPWHVKRGFNQYKAPPDCPGNLIWNSVKLGVWLEYAVRVFIGEKIKISVLNYPLLWLWVQVWQAWISWRNRGPCNSSSWPNKVSVHKSRRNSSIFFPIQI